MEQRTYNLDNDPFCISDAHFDAGETFELIIDGDKHRFMAITYKGKELFCIVECGLLEIMYRYASPICQCPDCECIIFREIT